MTKDDLKKPEIKFWISIITLAVISAIAFTTLKMEVKAMQDKGVRLRKEYESSAILLGEVRDTTTRLETNQKLLMENFGLKPVEK